MYVETWLQHSLKQFIGLFFPASTEPKCSPVVSVSGLSQLFPENVHRLCVSMAF